MVDPVRLDPFQRIIEVGWSGGGLGVLEVDMPQGVSLSFSPYGSTGIGPFADGATLVRADLVAEVNNVTPIASSVLSNLYDEPEELWVIDSIIFPISFDSTFGPGAYDAYKAGYVLPDYRFEEPTDLRTLGTDVRPGTGLSGYPSDGNWAGWDYGFYEPEHVPGYLPPPGPPAEANWGLGEQRSVIEHKRDLVRGIWILDFAKARIGNGTVTVANTSHDHDDRLGSYDMSFKLRTFRSAAVLTLDGLHLTANVEPLTDETRSAAYDQAGTLLTVKKGGFA